MNVEVSGISVNSSRVTNDQLSNTGSDVGNVLSGSGYESVMAVVSAIQKDVSNSVKVVQAIAKSVVNIEKNKSTNATKTGIKSNKQENTLVKSLTDNSKWLKELTETIRTSVLKIDVKGVGKNYLSQLLAFLQNDKMEKVMDINRTAFEKFVQTIARLSRYTSFIDKLGVSLHKTFSSIGRLSRSMLIFSGSLALLGVTIATFVTAISGEALVAFAGIMIALRMAGYVAKETGWDLAKLSVSVALLGIAIYAFTEAIDGERLMQFVGGIAVVSAVVWGFSKVSATINKNAKSMLSASGSIALLAGSFALFAWSMSTIPDINVQNVLVTGASLIGLAMIYKYIGEPAIAKNIALGSGVATLMGLSFPVLCWGLSKMKLVDVSLERAGEIGLMVAGLATMFGIIGIPVISGAVALGSLVAVGMAGGIWTLVQGLNQLNELSVNIDQFKNFSTASGLAVSAMLHLANPLNAGLIAVSAPIAMALAISTTYLAKSINHVSQLPFLDVSHYENFANSTLNLVKAYDVLGVGNSAKVILGALPVAMALSSATYFMIGAVEKVGKIPFLDVSHYDNYKNSVENLVKSYDVLGWGNSSKIIFGAVPVAGALNVSSWLIGGAVKAVGRVPLLKPTHYVNYKNAVDRLVEVYDNFGGWDLAKTTAKAGMMSIISSASIATALAIRLFTRSSRDPNAVSNAVDSIKKFMDGMLETFNTSGTNFDKTRDGIKAFAGIGNMVKGIADGVRVLGKMEFEEKEVVNGQLVTKRVTKLTPDDIKRVGTSIGSVLNALSEPLAGIGGQKDTYTIAGFKITNPFSNKVKNGVKALAKIGDILSPMVNTIKFFIESGLGDKAKVRAVGSGIATLLYTISTSFKRSTEDLKNQEFENMVKASKTLDDLTKAVSRKGFETGVTAFSSLSKEIVTVKDSLNAMDLMKLTKFSGMIGNLAELNRNQGLKALVEAFNKLIEELTRFKEIRQEEIKISGEKQKQIDELKKQLDEVRNNQSSVPAVGSGVLRNPIQTIQTVQSPQNNNSAQFDELMSKIENGLRGINSKLFELTGTIDKSVSSTPSIRIIPQK